MFRKKIVSIFAVSAIVFSSTHFAALAAEDSTTGALFIAPENFCGSDDTTGEALRRENIIKGVGLNAWNINSVIDSSSGYINNQLLARGSNNNRGTSPASVKVYCSNEASYTAYMQGYGSESSPRYNKISVNGGPWITAAAAETIPAVMNWFWTSTAEITLNAGWNTIEVVGDVINLRCTGIVLVPAGEEFALPKSADDSIITGGEAVSAVKDITYPVFDGDISAKATSNSITISEFKATDANNGGSAKDIAEYRVLYKTADAENYTTAAVLDNANDEYVINELISSTDYIVRIEAVDMLGQYVSREIEARTEDAAALPEFPDDAKISYTIDGAMNISWPAANLETGEISRYKVIVNGAVFDEIISDENQRVYSYAIKDLIPNTDYKIQVAAVNSSGDSAALPEITVNSGDLYTVNINQSNFETKGAWITQNDGDTLNSTGFSFYHNNIGIDNENPAAGKFYVPADGVYYIYANPKSGTGVSHADSRCFTMNIDGNQTKRDNKNQVWGVLAFANEKPFAFNWEASDPIQLNKGMHDIELFIGNYSKVDSIIITQRQLTLENLPVTKEAYKTTLEIYEDTEKPVFTNPITAAAEDDAVKLMWSASDANIAAYEIFKGDESIAVLDSNINEYSVSSLANGEYTFTVKAYDIAGNSESSISEPVRIEKSGIAIRNYNVDDVDNTVYYSIMNYDSSCNAVCVSALYNSDNELLACSVSNIALESGKEEYISQTLDYSGDVSGCRIATYIWDTNQKPLTGQINTEI